MRLLDFFIRISVQGGRAARELSGIMRNADRARAGLNGVGTSANNTGRRLNGMARNAANANMNLLRLLRTSRMRIGAGGTVGGMAVGATGGLGGLAAVGAAAGTFSRAKGLEDERSGHALAIGETNFDEMMRKRQQLIDAQERGLTYNVRGVNVLANATMTEIANAQNAMLKAGYSFSDVINGDVVPAFIALHRVAGDEASVEDISTALAKSKAMAAQMGITQVEAAAILTSIAASTEFAVDDVARALPRSAGLLRAMGADLTDFGQIMITSADQFGTAVLAANATRQMVNLASMDARRKGVRQIDERMGIDYSVDGKFRGWEYVREQMLRIERELGTEAATEYAYYRFGANGQRIALDLMHTSEADLAKARGQAVATQSGIMDANLLLQYQSMTGAIDKFSSAWDKLANALIKAGVLQLLTDAVSSLADGLTWLASVVEENPEAFKLFFEILGKALLLFIGLKAALTVFRIARVVAGFLRLASVGRFLWGVLQGLLRWVIIPLITALAAFLGIPVWVAAAIVAAIAAVATLIYIYWDEIVAFLFEVWGAIIDGAIAAWGAVADAAIVAWDAIKATATGAWTAIKDAAWEAVSSMFGWLSDVGSALADAWNSSREYATSTGAYARRPGDAPVGFAGVPLNGLGDGSTLIDNRRVSITGATPRQVETAATRAARTTRGVRPVR